MSSNPRRPLDNENGYEQRPAQYPHPSSLVPPQSARQAPVRQMSRPTIHQPKPQMGLERQQSRPDQYSQRPREQYTEQQQQPVQLQRQRSRPDQGPYPGQPLQRPQQPPYQDPRQQDLPLTLQRRPDQPYYPAPAPSQPQPPMADHQYKAVPVQSLEPALMRAPSAPSSQFSRSEYSETSTLAAPNRPYADSMLIRGNSDDDLDKSDLFWRRFNASAVQQQLPDAEKSSWLEKTTGKSTRHSRILWIVGAIFLILALAGIGIGIFVSFHNSSNATRPDTLGGSEDFTSAGSVAATAGGGGFNVGGVTPVAGGGGGDPTSSSLHVSPTNTVAR